MKSLFNRNKGSIGLFDIIIVLLNIAAGRGNYLLFGLTGINKGIYILGIVIIINVLYLSINRIQLQGNRIKYSPFAIIFILFFYNWLCVIALGSGDFVLVTEVTIEWVLFFLILRTLYFKLLNNSSVDMREGVENLSKGYVWLSFISIIGVFITFAALNFGIVSGGKEIRPDYMEANIDGGAVYLWTLLSVNDVHYEIGRIPFFQDYGFLDGLFHEPNVLAHNISPCIIILMGLVKKNIWRYVTVLSGILIMLFCASVTNILMLAICLIVYLFIKFRSSVIVPVLTATIVIAFVYLFIIYFDDGFVDFFIRRMDSGNSSNAYTSAVLEHTFVPHTIFGYNFLSTSYVSEEGVLDRTKDVGIIPWALNITFLIIYFRNVIKLVTKKDGVAMAVGFASLYYILHSAKGGMNMFLQTLPALLIFLQLYVLNYYGTIRNNKRSSQTGAGVKS